MKENISDLSRKEFDMDEVRDVLRELEFWNLLEEIESDIGVVTEKVDKKYLVLNDSKSLDKMIAKISKAALISVDLETTRKQMKHHKHRYRVARHTENSL